MTPRRPIAVALGLALILACLGTLLVSPRSGWGRSLARRSLDLLQTVPPSPPFDPATSPVTLVYVDADSHRELGQDPTGRWDRRLHTRLVRRLTAAGARAIVFDVLFDGAWPDPGVDREFAEAIRAHGHVILASEQRRTDQSAGTIPGIAVRSWSLPEPVLAAAAAAVGAAELAVDDDFVVRQSMRWIEHPDRPGLAWSAIQALGLAGSDSGAGIEDEGTHYYGPVLHLPHVSYHAALQPGGVDDQFFCGKVVFIGSRPIAGSFSERRDEDRHPLSFWGERNAFMPAVEIHATQFLNWMRGDSVRRWPLAGEKAFVVGTSLLLALLLARSRPVAGALGALGVAVGAVGIAGMTWSFQGRWFAWGIEALVLAPSAWGLSVVYHGLEWTWHRRHLEAQRRADRKRIEHQAALINRAQDVIALMDLEGRTLHANPAAAKLLRPGPAAGDGTPAGVWPNDDPQIPAFLEIREQVASLGEWSGTCETPDPIGGVRILECRASAILDAAGRAEAILVTGSDITERRRLEVEFLRAQKWETVGTLAGGMAHDLNNRLAPALLGLQLLREAPLDEKSRRMLATIENHTRLGSDTVRQVLRFLRGDAVEVVEIRPEELVRRLETFVVGAFPKSIRVASLIAPKVGRIRGNSTQLEQALLNLCLNARDAMPDGGDLTFAIDDVDLDSIEAARLRGGRAGPFVLIAVSDSGTGIAPEHLGRIFEPLFTTKSEGKGTGLGLASVARIVDAHEGCLGVTSEPGIGSTFEIYLPRLQETDPTAPQ